MPYPFQNNLRYLSPEDAYDCLVGLIDAPGGNGGDDFATWMERTFGEGITRHFMRPYNLKVWATPADLMSATWIAERVSVVDAKRALRSVMLGLDDVGWGPNNTFKFPRSGGTGEIYRRLADRLGDHVHYEAELVGVDAERREVRFSDGRTAGYDALVSTMPVDRLVAAIDDCPVRGARGGGVARAQRRLGARRRCRARRSPTIARGSTSPTTRCPSTGSRTSPSTRPRTCPARDTARYSSYLTETAYSRHRPGEPERLRDRVIDGLVATGLIDRDVPIASTHLIDVDYAYPIPTLERDAALAVIQPWLMEHEIYSRGRFGSWRYEIGNMDHAAKMGIDVARLLVEGRPEEVWPS